jgi:hypothetical protein
MTDGKVEDIGHGKPEQDEDLSSVAASEAGPAPGQLYHKPPTRQFLLIMIAYVPSLQSPQVFKWFMC